MSARSGDERDDVTPAPRRRRAWAASALIALALVLGALVWHRSRAFDPRRSPVGDALGRAVPSYVVAIDGWASGRKATTEAELARLRDAALSSSARRALGPDATGELEKILTAATNIARPSNEPPTPEAIDPFFAAATSFDQQLATRGVPYFVDADVLLRGARALPLIVTFYVEREETHLVDAQRERVVFLWRLDRLNFRDDYLGYTRPRLGAAVVLYDELESDLVRYVLPAVPAGERVELVDDESRDEEGEWQSALETRAAEVIRAHYAAAPAGERDAAVRIGKLLARRRQLVVKWRRQVAGLGLRLRVPERLIPEADYGDDLAKRVPRSELSEWDELHAELVATANERAFRALRDRYAAAVARHELQHRADYRRGLVPVPEPLQRLLGIPSGLDAPEGSRAARAREELSAYLATMATKDLGTARELVLLSRFLFDKRWWGYPYGDAAFVALKELATELGVPIAGPLTSRGAVVRPRAAAVLIAITERPDDELRAAAARVWERLYDAKLPDVRAVATTQREAWRH